MVFKTWVYKLFSLFCKKKKKGSLICYLVTLTSYYLCTSLLITGLHYNTSCDIYFQPIYGLTVSQFLPFKHASGGGRELHFTDEKEVDFEDLLTNLNPKSALETHLRSRFTQVLCLTIHCSRLARYTSFFFKIFFERRNCTNKEIIKNWRKKEDKIGES